MSSRFILRMQFGLQQDQNRIKDQLVKLVKNAPVDEIMFFFFAEEYNCGHEPLERIEEWINHTRPWVNALHAEGVGVSLNPWHSILHADRGRVLKSDQKWQTLVDPNGEQAGVQVCPLDPDWREYFSRQLQMYASEKFTTIWIDDDIRFHNHAPLEWGGCFCPLHIEVFNNRNGSNASREEIVSKCLEPGTPHPWRNIWLDIWNETQCELITAWRELLEPSGTALGLMSSVIEAHAAEGRRWVDWWQAFGGSKPPIHRPHFNSYGETFGRSLTSFIARMDQNRVIQPESVESYPEIDNGPYGPWNKPYRETMAQMALAHIHGCQGLSISLFDFMGNDIEDEPERITFLNKAKPVCSRMQELFPPTMVPMGIGIPFDENMGRTIHASAGDRWEELVCPVRGFSDLLGAAGLAFSMRTMAGVNAIAGPLAWTIPDADMQAFFEKGLMLDAEAALILVERGFGDYIGISGGAMTARNQASYSIERITDPAFGTRAGSMISINSEKAILQPRLLSGTVFVSEILTGETDVFGPGMLAFENQGGGRIIILPFAVTNGNHTYGGVAGSDAGQTIGMFTQRAVQLRKCADWLDTENVLTSAAGGGWLIPQYLSDGKQYRAVIWNGSQDAVETIKLKLPAQAGIPEQIMQYTAEGTMVEGTYQSGSIELAQPMYCWEWVTIQGTINDD